MRRQSKIEQVLEYLADGNSLTSLEATELFGETRLAARVFVLKKEGFHIIGTTEYGIDRFGNKTRYKRYRLEMPE